MPPAAVPSRLLARLDTAIARTRNPVEAACLKAERAAFIARQGHLEEAQRVIEELRAQFEWRPSAALTAWLALAEGLHDHYSHLGAAAIERVRRAYSLSTGAEHAALHALATAWLAHMEYVRHDMAAMAAHLKEALATAAADAHGARARAGLVAAEAYHFGGRLDRALPWYTRSRLHAAEDGDEAHLSALMHNQAWLRGSQARLAAVFGETPPGSARQALMGAESTGHFDVGVGTASLGSLVPVLRAQLLVEAGDHAQAVALYERHFDAAMADGLERLAACFLADLAWCHAQLGHVEAARAAAQRALQALAQPCDIDDRAVAQMRLARVFEAAGDAARTAALRERALRDLEAHRGEQQRLVALLDEHLTGVDVATA